MTRVRAERRLCLGRKKTLEENRLKMEAEMTQKEADLDDVTRKLMTRTSNSPTIFDQLTAVIELLRCDLWGLGAKLETMKEQARGLTGEHHKQQKYIDYLNGELETRFKV